MQESQIIPTTFIKKIFEFFLFYLQLSVNFSVRRDERITNAQKVSELDKIDNIDFEKLNYIKIFNFFFENFYCQGSPK